MIINLSPVLVDAKIEASVEGDVLTINGETFDFEKLKAGQILPLGAIDSEHFAGPVVRHDTGLLEVTLRLPNAADSSENLRFPEVLRVESGPVPFPENEAVEEVPPPMPEVAEEELAPGPEVQGD